MQWRHRSMRIALHDINKKGVEIGERQNRCHDDIIKFDSPKYLLSKLTYLGNIELLLLSTFIICLQLWKS